MPEYLAPGVYVEEIDTGSKPIEGVSTSTTGMVGVTERGPVNVPILVTSYGEFTRWFGERLSIRDFSQNGRPHCYLPHAAEGFFTNGGKRLYVVRVLDTDGATSAAAFAFDRGAVGAADTMILRTAGELSGTAANLPLLYVLDTSALNVNDWIRIGDGSTAEYRQVAHVGAPVDNTHVPLDFPLSRSHNAGVSIEQFAYAVDNVTYAGTFTVVAPPGTQSTQVGDQSITLTGAAADITALAGSANQLIEIGDANQGEYRFVTGVTVTAADQANIQLDSPLLRAYNDGADVRPLQMALPPINPNMTAALGLSAAAGDTLIFADDRNGEFDTRNDLVVINSADVNEREVRRIGVLSQLTFSTGAYEDYPTGSIVDVVTLEDDDRAIVGGPTVVGQTTITVDDITALSVGQTVQIGAAADPLRETGVIQAITPDPNPANAPQGDITFTAGLANAPHNTGDPVAPQVKALTAAANAASSVLAVDNRVGLSVGDVLRIGTAPNDEYVTIRALPNPSPGGVAPNAGNIVLIHSLSRTHAVGTEIRRQHPPTLSGAQSTVLAVEGGASGTNMLVTDGNGYVASDFVRLTTFSNEIFYHRMAQAATTVTPAEVTLTTALERTHGTGSMLVGRDPLIQIQALDAGRWGNRLRISVEDEPTGLVSRTTLRTIVDATHIRLASAAGVEAGTVLELLNPLNNNAVVGTPLKVVSIDRSSNVIALAGPGLSAAQQVAEAAAVAAGTHLSVRSRECRLSVYLLRQPDPAMPSRNETVIATEVFRHLSMDPRHSRYIETVIGDIDGDLRLSDRRPEGASQYIRVRDLAPDQATEESIRLGPETLVDILPNGTQRPARHALASGDDSMATLTDDVYIGTDAADPEDRTGLHSLRNVEQISLVAIPGQTRPTIQQALIDHCELMRYRFAVLDGALPPNDSLTDVQTQRQQFDTKYAALYHPWSLIPDPFPANLNQIAPFPIPPSGHVLGIYARTDVERGVHKAPANEVVRGILGLRRLLNKGEHDILNPSPVNINVIRDFRRNNRGIRVWGGRVITSDPDWKYVNVRRLLIFIEHSIDRGLQWVVFEPNAEPLWARVRRTISNFLTVVWRNGALEGTTVEEAFFVKCDRTTMTQTDIDNGRLICVVGVAPVKPAEFVIIRIGLWTAHAED